MAHSAIDGAGLTGMCLFGLLLCSTSSFPSGSVIYSPESSWEGRGAACAGETHMRKPFSSTWSAASKPPKGYVAFAMLTNR